MIVSESFVVADWSDPGTHPGLPIAPLHLHRSDDEAWIVLEGRLGFRIGDEEHEVAAGESALAPRGMPHSVLERRRRAGPLPARDDAAHPPADRGPAHRRPERLRADLRRARLRAARLAAPQTGNYNRRMTAYTHKNLRADVEDSAVQFGLSPSLEAHFARTALDCESTGVSFQRLAPNFRVPFGHKHAEQEEIYVVLSGSGRAKLDDDARRPPAVRRAARRARDRPRLRGRAGRPGADRIRRSAQRRERLRVAAGLVGRIVLTASPSPEGATMLKEFKDFLLRGQPDRARRRVRDGRRVRGARHRARHRPRHADHRRDHRQGRLQRPHLHDPPRAVPLRLVHHRRHHLRLDRGRRLLLHRQAGRRAHRALRQAGGGGRPERRGTAPPGAARRTQGARALRDACSATRHSSRASRCPPPAARRRRRSRRRSRPATTPRPSARRRASSPTSPRSDGRRSCREPPRSRATPPSTGRRTRSCTTWKRRRSAISRATG